MGVRMLEVSEVAEQLGVSRKMVRRMIHDGRLECVDLNDGTGKRPCFRIPETSIEERIQTPEARVARKIVTR